MIMCMDNRIKEMMRRSFAEIDSAQTYSKRKKELDKLEKEFTSFKGLDNCLKCVPSIDEYYQKCSRINELTQRMQVRVCGLFSLYSLNHVCGSIPSWVA